MFRILMITFACGLFLFLSACGNQESPTTAQKGTSANEVKKEVREATDAVGDYTKEKMAEYQHSLEAQLQALDRKQEELEEKARQAGKETQAEMQEVIEKLKTQKEEVDIQLQKLSLATGEAWKEMKSATDKALENLKAGYNRALEKFSS